MKRTQLVLLIVVCTGLAAALTPALGAAEPAATGRIEGRVLNSANGEYVGNARLSVEATLLEAFTQSDGTYRLSNIPAGTVTVKAFFTGHPGLTRSVAVTAGQIVQLDLDLATGPRGPGADGGVVQLSEFVVSTKRDMEGAAIAINEQRFAPNMKSVVSTDEFGDIAEGSLGEFMKFLPGVSIEYTAGALARGISVNGVSSEYVPIMVDGFSLASAGDQNATGRNVQTDMLSITNISRIEVAYSPTPESRGSALAGSVNMVPRSAFERSRPVFNASVFLMMRSNAHDIKKTPGPFETPTRKIKPGFDFSYIRPVNSRFGFTLSGGRTSNGTKEEFIQNTWRGAGSATNGNAFPNTTPDKPYLTSTQVRDGTKDATRSSAGITLDYRFSRNDRVSFSFQYYFVDFLVMNRTLTFNITRVNPGDFTAFSTRGAPGQGDLQLANNYRDRTTKTATPTLVWRHDGPVWKAETGLGLSLARQTRRDIDKGYFTTTTARRTNASVSFADIFYLRPNTITVADGATGAPLDPYTINNYAMTAATSNPVTSSDLQRGAHASLAREFTGRLPFTLKGGVDFRHDQRDQKAVTIPYTFLGADGRSSTTPVGSDDSAAPFFAPVYSQRTPAFGFPRVQWVDNEKVWDYYQTNPTRITPNANNGYRSSVSGSRWAGELVSSAYLRGDLPLLERRLKLVGGVRAEQTTINAQGPLTDPTRAFRRDASGRVILTNGAPSLLVPANAGLPYSQLTYIERGAKVDKEYLRYFPSLNASYNIRENLIARAATYLSIGRPNFNQYTGELTLPDESAPPSPNNRIAVNNPGIKPWSARTVNARLEYYFEGVGQLSVGAFRRDFENFFGNVTSRATPAFLALYDLDPNTYGAFDVSTQHNIADTVRMTGYDFAYKQSLTFLPHWARGVQVFANAASQRTIGPASSNFSGFFPRKASWGASLSREKFNVRVNGSYQGRARQNAVGSGLSIEPGTFNWASKRSFIDLAGEYYFMKKFAVFFNIRNVRNMPEDFEIAGPNTPEHAQFRSREQAGALWTLGVRGTF